MSWERLNRKYREDGLVLVLGAGVSVDSRLPTWPELLQRLAAVSLGENGRDLFDRLKKQGLSLPSIATILRVKLPAYELFCEKVREALYGGFEFYPNGVDKHNRQQLIRHVRENNQTLRAVAGLCAVRGADNRNYSANPRVHAVVTLNLDALLQAYIYARYEKRLVRTIERPSASRRPDKINVYHMHGFLRFDQKAGMQMRETDKMVLTEQEYFDFFNAPTSLFNYTFLHLLREYSCLFIGLSMQDDNVRRLLHYSRQERKRALLDEWEFRKDIDDLEKTSKAEEKALRHFAILKHSGSTDVDELVELSLKRLGTSVLWIGEYPQIAERIAAAYESAGQAWESVN